MRCYHVAARGALTPQPQPQAAGRSVAPQTTLLEATLLATTGGVEGAKGGQFSQPMGLALSVDKSTLFVADSHNHRVCTFGVLMRGGGEGDEGGEGGESESEGEGGSSSARAVLTYLGSFGNEGEAYASLLRGPSEDGTRRHACARNPLHCPARYPV